MEKLLEAGALDVSFTPIQMKKNRPGIEADASSPRRRIGKRWPRSCSRETSTLGVRMYNAERRVQSRRDRARGYAVRTGSREVSRNRAPPRRNSTIAASSRASHNVPLKQVMAEATLQPT